MFTFCEVVTNVTVGRIGTYDGHIICVCFTNVHDRFETPLKLFVPILCKHCESTIVAVGGIRVNIMVDFFLIFLIYCGQRIGTHLHTNEQE